MSYHPGSRALRLALIFAAYGTGLARGEEPGAAPLPATEEGWQQGLDQHVRELLDLWGVPGGAVVVVDDTGILWARGLGVRRVGTDAEFDLDTVFPIASNTKPFTAAAIGRLVDQGKVEWDDPVVKHLPEFRISDPYFTEHLTVRDFLCHRSGLEEHAADAYIMPRVMTGRPCEKALLMEWSKFLIPMHGLRQVAAYSNLGYLILADLIAQVSGRPYAEFLQNEIFDPLDMTSAVAGAGAFATMENRTTSHELDPKGALAPSSWNIISDCTEGSGSIHASPSDLAAFVQMFLAGGLYGNTRVLASETVAEILEAQMVVTPSPFQREAHGTEMKAWTLGWEKAQYKGKTLIRMGGFGPGHQNTMMMLPREKLGVLVFQNYSPAFFYVSAAYSVIDRALGLPSSDWGRTYRQFIPEIPRRVAVELPVENLGDYVGVYTMGGYQREIVDTEGHLYLLGTSPVGGPPVGRAQLFDLGNDVLFIRTADAVFRFTRDSEGFVTGYVENFFGVENSFERVRWPGGRRRSPPTQPRRTTAP